MTLDTRQLPYPCLAIPLVWTLVMSNDDTNTMLDGCRFSGHAKSLHGVAFKRSSMWSSLALGTTDEMFQVDASRLADSMQLS
jgi:hypothetical protein